MKELLEGTAGSRKLKADAVATISIFQNQYPSARYKKQGKCRQKNYRLVTKWKQRYYL